VAQSELWRKYHSIPNGYQAQLHLSPGEYDIVVVAGDGEKFGRAEKRVIVERYETSELAVSDLILSKRVHEVLARSTGFRGLVSNDLEFAQSADTRFKKTDQLFSYFEIYAPQTGQGEPPRVFFQLKVINVKTNEVKADTGVQSAERWMQAGTPLIPVGREITIDKLAPGVYRLEVQASDSLGNSTVWRAANFSIE
jgi:hypothetical protein